MPLIKFGLGQKQYSKWVIFALKLQSLRLNLLDLDITQNGLIKLHLLDQLYAFIQ
jgi:hypothetical protein